MPMFIRMVVLDMSKCHVISFKDVFAALFMDYTM